MKRGFSFFLLFWALLGTAHAYLDEVVPPLETFSGFKPTYFLVGKPDAKIQFSLKAQVVKAVPVYFAYTQLIFWDMFGDSAPFRNVDYNPEAFYRLNLAEKPNRRWIDFGFFDHESNGRAGDDSRSWDRVFLQFSDTVEWGERPNQSSGLKFHWSVRTWFPYNFDKTNSDFPHYRGLFESTVSLSGFLGELWERDEITLRFYFGGENYVNPLRGGQELTVRTKLKARPFLPLVVGQIFHGYAENTVNYKDHRFGLRIGIGF